FLRAHPLALRGGTAAVLRHRGGAAQRATLLGGAGGDRALPGARVRRAARGRAPDPRAGPRVASAHPPRLRAGDGLGARSAHRGEPARGYAIQPGALRAALRTGEKRPRLPRGHPTSRRLAGADAARKGAGAYGSAGGSALGSLAAAAGHPRGRAPAPRRQRLDRRGAGRLLSLHQPDGPGGLGQPRPRQSLRRRQLHLDLHAADQPADLPGRPPAGEPRRGGDLQGDRDRQLPARHPGGLPRGGGRAGGAQGDRGAGAGAGGAGGGERAPLCARGAALPRGHRQLRHPADGAARPLRRAAGAHRRAVRASAQPRGSLSRAGRRLARARRPGRGRLKPKTDAPREGLCFHSLPMGSRTRTLLGIAGIVLVVFLIVLGLVLRGTTAAWGRAVLEVAGGAGTVVGFAGVVTERGSAWVLVPFVAAVALWAALRGRPTGAL